MSTDRPTIFAPIDKYYWFDIYDFSEPARPVWLDALESAGRLIITPGTQNPLFVHEGLLHQVYDGGVFDASGALWAIATYSIGEDWPLMKGLALVPGLASFSFNEGTLFAIPPPRSPLTSEAIIYLFDLRTPTVLQTTLRLPLPIPDAPVMLSSVTGAGKRLYVYLQQTRGSEVGPPVLAVYNFSSDPARLIGTLPGIGSRKLRVSGRLLVADCEIFDISGDLPVKVSSIPGGLYITDLNGSRVLARTGQTGIRIIDISDPNEPKITASLMDRFSGAPRWYGEHVLGMGLGIGVYHATPPGGPIIKAGLGGIGFAAAFDQVVRSPYLFVAENTERGGMVNIFDVASTPAKLVASYSEMQQVPLSLQLFGNHLFVGMDKSIAVVDVNSPVKPIRVASLNLPTLSLSQVRNILFIGTLDNRLVVLDVTQPASPVTLTSVGLPDRPVIMRSTGDLLFIAAGRAGLLIYKVSNPATPVLLSQYRPSSLIVDLQIDGNIALLAALEHGLILADISNPAQPSLLGRVRLEVNPFAIFFESSSSKPVKALSVAIQNGIAYIGTEDANGMVYGRLPPSCPPPFSFTGGIRRVHYWCFCTEFCVPPVGYVRRRRVRSKRPCFPG